MATTVTTATLKVDITETITLNGTTYDKTTTQSITGIAQYTSRVYQLKASTTHTVVEFASDPSNNVFDSDDFKYMRITNLDDTNAVNLTFATESNVGCAFQLDAGESFVISALTVDSNTSGGAITTLGHTISDLFIRTGASETDVEIVVATA
ncbi:MAG: hypothetical protein Unbinned1953contig1002_13 [Prokaryotic dsDNA virus sp.]|nr:MAG: hypothetical protein Unbinned1953contig1002_13 [Prokaryotic dsDNA virus sp.]|tara:strand:- start:8547 stop:9002 length:456 start_codon:yes stop_codon:yes gene_type:complete